MPNIDPAETVDPGTQKGRASTLKPRAPTIFDAANHAATSTPPWLIYSVFLLQMSKGLVSSAVLGGATALYMNAFDGIAVYLFVVAFGLFFLWRFIRSAGTILINPLVRALYSAEAGSVFSRLAVLEAIFEIMKLLVFFLTIFAFSRYFEAIHQINYDIGDIPILRFFVFSLEAIEDHVLKSQIFTGTVSQIISSISTTILSMLILGALGFRWSRKKK